MATVKELREEAKSLEVTGYSSIGKEELEEAVWEARVQLMDESHTSESLSEEASRLEIDGRSSMNKRQLIEAILLHNDAELESGQAEIEEDDRDTQDRDLPDTEPPPPEEVEHAQEEARTEEPRRRLVGEPRVGVRGEARGSRVRQGPVTRQRTIGRTTR